MSIESATDDGAADRTGRWWRTLVPQVGRVLAALVVAIALLALVGWTVDSAALTSVLPGLVSMKVNTALSLALLALVCLLPRRTPTVVGVALAGLVSAVALLSIVEYLAGVSFGIDELFVRDPDRSTAPGRMSGTTALCLVLISLTVALPARRVVAQVAAVSAQMLAFLGLLGYLYGVEGLYRVGPFETMALHTSIAVVLLGAAAQLQVPGSVLGWVLSGTDAGALLLRRIFPVLLIGLPLVGLARVQAERQGYFDVAFGTALTVSSAILLLTLVMLVAGRGAERLDERRRRSVEELAELNHSLERRVTEGAAELERQHTQLALRSDRDRIARDLHDRVIQRLFASGLQLVSLQRSVARSSQPEAEVQAMSARIEEVLAELDGVSGELRASIFSLTMMARSGDAVGAARGAVAHLGRSVAFEPEVEIDPALDAQPVELVDQVLAVLREGVSNVARHARGTWARVAVSVADERLLIVVEDDGVGMPDPLERASGVANLRQRAEEHGGTARWERREPRGTRLVWEAPVTVSPSVAAGDPGAAQAPTAAGTGRDIREER